MIYKFGPCPDGKYYIGQTTGLDRRLLDHEKMNGSSPEFHKAVKRFGWDVFRETVEIAAETDSSQEEADILERLFITKFNALIPHGYNMTVGGRGRRFEPGAAVDFIESPVTTEEIRHMADWLVSDQSPKGECPCCGMENFSDFTESGCRCGVDLDFIRFLLRHIAQGATLADLPLIDDSKLIERWRRSRDAQFFMDCQIRREKGRTIAKDGPIAAQKYAERFWPYLETSLRRRCLRARGLPSNSLQPFKPIPGGKELENKRINTEFLLRKNRNELGTGENNVKVFAMILGREKKQCGKYYDAILSVFSERGGSPKEIDEAKKRAMIDQSHSEPTLAAGHAVKSRKSPTWDSRSQV